LVFLAEHRRDLGDVRMTSRGPWLPSCICIDQTKNRRYPVSFAPAVDGTRLYYEEVGAGTTILFICEFAGDHRSWEPQLRSFARRYHCVVYAPRGYPPSDVPGDVAAYSQHLAVTDAVAVLEHLGIQSAHVVGLSMGGFTALHLAMQRPDVTRSIVVGATGYGAHPSARESFRAESAAIAAAFRNEGAAGIAPRYAEGPARVQFQNKDPRGWAEFAEHLAEHSGEGAAHTMLGVQRERPSLYDLRDSLAAVEVPTLLVVGDEDEGCLDATLMLKRTMGAAALAVFPRTGHTVNLEEPELFNRVVSDFVTTVDGGRWRQRDPRSISATTTGITD
jgi:pimeloyl-ACP methyl ester carboxylesterase